MCVLLARRELDEESEQAKAILDAIGIQYRTVFAKPDELTPQLFTDEGYVMPTLHAIRVYADYVEKQRAAVVS